MLLSIIIPVYNKEIYLERCFAALLPQLDEHCEVICVDDGSTDSSGRLLDAYSESNVQVKVIHKKNGGVSSARNIGLQRAQGKYIAWCDPDDYVAADWYISLLPVLQKDYDMIYFDHFRYEHGTSEEKCYGGPSRLLNKIKYLQELNDDITVLSYLVTRIYKKELFQGILFPENIQLMEDFSVMHKLVYEAESIYYLAKPLYYYSINSDSICRTADIASRYSATIIAKERYNWLLSKGIQISKCGYLWHKLTFCSWYCHAFGRRSDPCYDKARKAIMEDVQDIVWTANISMRDKVKYCLICLDVFPTMVYVLDKLKNIADCLRNGGVKRNLPAWHLAGQAGAALC